MAMTCANKKESCVEVLRVAYRLFLCYNVFITVYCGRNQTDEFYEQSAQ